MLAPTRGRLLDASAAPETGESVLRLAEMNGLVIEHILSSALDEPVDYDQDHDEWVVLLEGAAELDVSGERVSLVRGDWLLLPRRTRHRVVRAAPGTSWLAVHGPRR